MGTPHTINFVSTDPDSDNIRNGIDWDADGSVNEWVPPSGYVASGQSQSASRTYAIPGEKTVKVMAQDEGGLSSDWATLSFTCTAAPEGETTVGLDEPGSGTNEGSGNTSPSSPILDLRVIPSLVRSGNTTQVNWSAQNVRSCTVTAPNGDTWTGVQSPLGGKTSRAITAETTYTLSCIDLNGSTLTKAATVRILPTWRER
jgi:hypothetical protein